jgi:hypothetical protein
MTLGSSPCSVLHESGAGDPPETYTPRRRRWRRGYIPELAAAPVIVAVVAG